MKKKGNIQKIVIPVLIVLIIINIVILIIMFTNKPKKEEKLIDIKDLAMVITKNTSSKIEVLTKKHVKHRRLKWTSSDSNILDVSDCNRFNECFLKPKSTGQVDVTVTYTDDKKKIKQSDTVTISIIDSEIINFYLYNSKLYVDKLSAPIYSDNPMYEKKGIYVCKDPDCTFINGEYHVIVNDEGNRYKHLDTKTLGRNTKGITDSLTCAEMLCYDSILGNLYDEFKMSEVKGIIDNYDSINLLVIGDNKKNKGLYSTSLHKLKDINFNYYSKIQGYVEEQKILLNDTQKNYIYDYESDDLITTNYNGKSLAVVNSNAKYYFLSKDENNYNKDCVVLDSNYNFLFNSKVFEYAEIINNLLFTYETNNGKRIAHIYNLDGNEIKNYLDENFELFGYYGQYSVGKLNNKLVFINNFNKQIYRSEYDIDSNNYTYQVLSKSEQKIYENKYNITFADLDKKFESFILEQYIYKGQSVGMESKKVYFSVDNNSKTLKIEKVENIN